jgi:hypothetical protein
MAPPLALDRRDDRDVGEEREVPRFDTRKLSTHHGDERH